MVHCAVEVNLLHYSIVVISMKKSMMTTMAGASLLLLALAGCAAPTATPTDDDEAPPSTDSETVDAADLMVAESSLGEIVVDGEGMTVYVFDNDTADSGESSCAGDCAAAWPAVSPAADEPVVDGVTGEVGTITGTDGNPQLTINGLPVYYFANDSAPGDVNGQGVNGVWWVISPSGEKIG
jgi:predicted lipoprotein with Yx(FWY)xxD motif